MTTKNQASSNAKVYSEQKAVIKSVRNSQMNVSKNDNLMQRILVNAKILGKNGALSGRYSNSK